jgi:hypothetical protein
VTPASAELAEIRNRPRPRRRVSPEQRAELLARENEACGPHHFLQRVAAVIEAAKTGDARLLAGSLDDVAAAALVWEERTLLDWAHRYQPPKL